MCKLAGARNHETYSRKVAKIVFLMGLMNLFIIHSLPFLKSYNKGHCMDVVKNGLMSGADVVETFSGRTKNKVFFFVQPKSGTVYKGLMLHVSCQLIFSLNE